jgi:(1->4)-alpha-D-glucan 1-alpha-D-glucosylmutase
VIPRATYRLQFGPDFGFAQAAALAPYLAALGVSHVYLAPVFAARPGSTHGYDVTDPGAFNPELGGEAGFRAMAASFGAEGLGLLLDIVPNHMGIGGASNRYWLDVLAWGRESRFAGWFDIDWQAEGGRVVVPVLGEAFGPALEAGALALRHEAGHFAIWAHDTHCLPVAPRSYALLLETVGLDGLASVARTLDRADPEDPGWEALHEAVAGSTETGAVLERFRDPEALARLLAVQNWRVAKFSYDRDGLNYRRFFAISDLAGVRIEDRAVFEATQWLALDLVGKGLVDGLRVDHVDGLRDPKEYLARLRAGSERRFWLLVEKILAADEAVPADWDCDGTTGYEVGNLLVGLLVDPVGEAAITEGYRRFTGREDDPRVVVREAKREVLTRMLGSELAGLTRRFLAVAAASERFRDLGEGTVRTALIETIAALGVYRTYGDMSGIDTDGRQLVAAAVTAARSAATWLDPDVWSLVEAVLSFDPGFRAQDEGERREAALRFQQLSGPAMAKGLEDTALYRYARLIALNEVGSEPGRFGTTPEAFHRANAARQRQSPRALLATSTHDTKRGEDARARIAALQGHAGDWAEAVEEWHQLLEDPTAPIDRNDAYFFYQLLVGAWPFEWRAMPADDALASLRDRVQAAMLKSVREASVHTTWVFGNPDYEARVAAFVDRAMAADGRFLAAFRRFEATVARDGAANALIQTALKLTIPGVPDLYRGAEVWEQSLVDPDNRRPFDFASAAQRLAALPPGAEAFADWTSPQAKLALTARLLAARCEWPALFAEGSYEPLDAGPGSCGFLRRHGAATLAVLIRFPFAEGVPELLVAGRWRDLLTGGEREGGSVPFETLPVAALLQA